MERRIALVTGGTSKIGIEIVRSLAVDHEVHFTYCTNSEVADDLAKSCDSIPHRIDFLSEWAVPDIQPSVLVNNAGINISGHPARDTPDSEILASIQVNTLAALRLANAFSAKMIKDRFGRIVSINSIYGLRVPSKRLSYGISKFALRAVTSCLADELAPHNVTVNDVCPGPVDTSMLRAMGRSAVSEGRATSVESYMSEVADEMPIKRLIAAREVAEAVRFLSSDGGGGCTGIALQVDGGMRL